MAGWWLVTACLAFAALTLLAPSSPSYDPFAWIVWGRELMPGAGGEPFTLAGGPSWKPLPLLFTTPFALAGSAAPALWLIVTRAGLSLALAGAFALGRRLGGVLAGAVAAVALLLLADLLSLAWRGGSEPLLLACILWAVERHLAGRRALAFALGVAAALIRPELTLFLGLYAVWQWRDAGRRERTFLVAGIALVVLLWIGLPGLAGDPLAASTTARSPSTRTSAGSALHGDLRLALAAVWALALAAVALRLHERTMRALAVGALAWLGLLSAMAAVGYASPARYGLPAAACACVLAGVGVAALAERVRDRSAASGRGGAVAWTAGGLCAGGAARDPGGAPARPARRPGARGDRGRPRPRRAAHGDRARRRRGAVARLRADRLDRRQPHDRQHACLGAARQPRPRRARDERPGLLVQAPRSPAAGAPPIVTSRLRRGRPTAVAHAGAWTVLCRPPPLPAACTRKASGSRRRIPNI